MIEGMTQFPDAAYEGIMPTAYLTAYPRIFTDIPYSREIFECLVRLRAADGEPELGEDSKIPRLAPELEARYNLTDLCLARSGIKQVLELAAGLSPRGMLMTSADKDARYVELDLNEMAATKRKIITEVMGNTPPNLRIVGGNALRWSDIESATETLGTTQPIAVVNEGLLRYLSFPEKAQVARNIFDLLAKFNRGVWITHDVTPQKLLAAQNATIPGMNSNLSKITGTNFDDTSFRDEAHARQFFGQLGFSAEVHHSVSIIDELTSPGRLALSREDVVGMIGAGMVFVMTPDPSKA